MCHPISLLLEDGQTDRMTTILQCLGSGKCDITGEIKENSLVSLMARDGGSEKIAKGMMVMMAQMRVEVIMQMMIMMKMKMKMMTGRERGQRVRQMVQTKMKIIQVTKRKTKREMKEREVHGMTDFLQD